MGGVRATTKSIQLWECWVLSFEKLHLRDMYQQPFRIDAIYEEEKVVFIYRPNLWRINDPPGLPDRRLRAS
jgi:hypothetical protein